MVRAWQNNNVIENVLKSLAFWNEDIGKGHKAVHVD